VNYYHVDFHAVTKGNDFQAINRFVERYQSVVWNSKFNHFNVTLPSEKGHPKLVQTMKQNGVIRTNCVDCLDRTNAWMTKIAFLSLCDMLESSGLEKGMNRVPLSAVDQKTENKSEFIWKFKNIWADNGDNISISYTGTGATTSSTTRHGKGGIGATFDHKFKSISRFYLANVEDVYKEKALGALTGPGVLESKQSTSVIDTTKLDQQLQKLKSKEKLFTTTSLVKINVLTWSSNIEKAQIDETVPETFLSKYPLVFDTDIFVIGIQDTYKISAMNFMNLDSQMSEISARWTEVLGNYFRIKNPTFQMVKQSHFGDLFMIVFATSKIFPFITNIQLDGIQFSVYKKLSKKGAAMIRFNIYDSSLIFINAHLTSDLDY
jgi:hypothetical protein